ncbi:MAG: hypothetical protein IPO92_17805, partial [Saprospiraceae bacterium]|nr:hypothetical protein [Saprospiraceae bacterium]
GGLTVTYHSTLANAIAGIGALTPLFPSPSTTIFARVFNPATGCFDIADIILNVNALPTGIAIQNVNNGNATTNFDVCAGSEIELSVNNGTAVLPVTYNWTVDGVPNPGTFPIPSAVIATHDGVWQVTVTDANGCTATDNITITVDPNPLNTCANATTLIDNAAPINGTTACASAFNTGFCGLNTTTSHTVFYRYTVPAGNTTNTNIVFTVAPNTLTTGSAATDLNIGLFTSCAGAPYTTTTVSGDLCNPAAGLVTITCIAPGTMLLIAIGSSDTNEGDFSITIDETNAGVPVNDLCTSPTPVVLQLIATLQQLLEIL